MAQNIEEVEEGIEVIENDGTQEKHLNRWPNDSKQTGLSSVQVEDDCVEQVTVFKCRACHFTAPEKVSIVHHYTKEHVKGVLANTNLQSTGGELEKCSSFYADTNFLFKTYKLGPHVFLFFIVFRCNTCK